MGIDAVTTLVHVELATAVTAAAGVPPRLASCDAVAPATLMEPAKTSVTGLPVVAQVLATQPNEPLA